MLELVRELAAELGVEVAWHTGSVPQQRRRAEIDRFKQDPACRLFLSTDSGSVGLNLQVASAVVNVDLPWNPAKLEQRIARAWRKNQTRAVTVVNLVMRKFDRALHSASSGQKQALADGVLDGTDDFSAIKMPSGRAAMVERMQAMLEAAPPIKMRSPEEALIEEMRARLGASFVLAEMRGGRVLVVLDADEASIANERGRYSERSGMPAVEVIGRSAWEAMQRLVEFGVLQFVGEMARLFHRAEPPAGADIVLRAAE